MPKTTIHPPAGGPVSPSRGAGLRVGMGRRPLSGKGGFDPASLKGPKAPAPGPKGAGRLPRLPGRGGNR
jgi:hypothetical protein